MKVWAVYTGLRLTTSIKQKWVYEEIGIAVVNPFNLQMVHTVMCV